MECGRCDIGKGDESWKFTFDDQSVSVSFSYAALKAVVVRIMHYA